MKVSLKALSVLLPLLVTIACSKKEDVDPILIQGHGITFNSATLYWHDVFPPAEHFSIKIYLNEKLIAELEDAWSYKLNNLDETTTYSGRIDAINLVTNEKNSALFSFTTLENIPPEDISVHIKQITGNSITVSWTEPYDRDGDTIYFDIIVNNMLVVENLLGTNCTINELSPLTNYNLSVLAKDNHGNEVNDKLNFRTLEQGAELTHMNGKFGGLEREFGAYIPYNKGTGKIPLVIRLHGWGLTIWPFMIDDYFVKLAQKEKFIHIQPQGTINDVGDPRWNFYESDDDLNFMNELIDTMIINYNADPERIYLVGFSNGGGFTIYLAKKLEDRLAAIAPIAASTYTTYTLKKPMPLCYVHGTTDDDEYRENGTPIDYDERLKFWIENNEVNPEPIITELEDIDKTDNSTVTKFEYINPNSSGDIVFYRINNGGHTIPGVYWPANQDINAYDEIWRFFRTRRLGDK